jgi:hypothetical protein
MSEQCAATRCGINEITASPARVRWNEEVPLEQGKEYDRARHEIARRMFLHSNSYSQG